MNDTQKMLQAIINGQNALKQDLVSRIDRLDEKLGGRIDSLEERVGMVEKNLTKRINNLGRQLAYLEDDTPTREEFDNLEKRVDRMEQKVASTI